MVEMSKLGGAPARTFGMLLAVYAISCGDPQTTGDSPNQAQLGFTNGDRDICSFEEDVGLVRSACKAGDPEQFCTYEVPTGTLHLDGGCRYRGRLKITQSNVTLDCHDAIIEGEGTTDGASFGILVTSLDQDPPSPPQTITAKNCNVQNFRVGIGVQNATKNSANSPKGVRLQNVHVKNSNANGIYIYSYVEGVLITDSRVENSSGPGIHLSHHSGKTRVEYSQVFLNGLRAALGPPTIDGPSPREGLTIDGSSDNEIVGNTFDKNGAGGIFLYSGCGEDNHDQNPDATNNLIFKNTFKNSPRAIWVASRQSKNVDTLACDPTPNGEVIHERSASPYGFGRKVPVTALAKCIDPSNDGDPDTDDLCTWNVNFPTAPSCDCSPGGGCSAACEWEIRKGAYFEDFVVGTTISKNVIHALTSYCPEGLPEDQCTRPDTAIRVEDDNTKVWKNAFVGPDTGTLQGNLLRIGTPLRMYFKREPVRDVVVDGNGYLKMSKADFDAGVKYEFGSWSPTNPAPTRTEQACQQDGKIVPPHSSDTFYRAREAAVCESEERSCRNGVLSGSFAYADCD